MSLYPLSNLPYGVFTGPAGGPRIGVRLHDDVVDLRAAEEAGLLDAGGTLRAPTLNDFMARGRTEWGLVRSRLQSLLSDPASAESLLTPVEAVTMRLPFEVADYVDFYSAKHHAENAGRIFRPDAEPLLPNWTHLPVGYHGRAGTVIVSGTPVVRPSGQRRGADGPSFGPCERLDVEAEIGFVVGTPSRLGTPLSTVDFPEHVFGVTLVNDWSARDIQAWEGQPLGPFLAKSFATSISPWITPLDALSAARFAPPAQDPAVLPYLERADPWGLDLAMQIEWNGAVVSRPSYRDIYWTADQQLAHLTVNGASTRTGDLYASGTVSGPTREERGSFLELSWGGRDEVVLADGVVRTFLEDGDTVTISGTFPGPAGEPLGLGEVTGTIRPVRA